MIIHVIMYRTWNGALVPSVDARSPFVSPVRAIRELAHLQVKHPESHYEIKQFEMVG